MSRNTLMLMAVVVAGCGGGDSGDPEGNNKSLLPANYGHGCGTNADCNDLEGTSCNGISGLMCIASCSSNTDCRAGTTCTGNGCSQNCERSADCLNGGECVLNGSKTGICGYPPTATLGAHCKEAYECQTYDCRSTPNHPDGYCTASCTTSDDCGTGVCVVLSSSTTGFCAPRCETPGTRGPCTNESTCQPLNGVSYGFCY